MRHTATFLLLVLLVMSGMLTTGCGSRIAASIQSVSTPVVPRSVTWAAVPGPGLSADDPSVQLLVEQTAVPLATALALHDWKWLSNPAQAQDADILVRIGWGTGAPRYIREFAPFPRYGLGMGMGWRHGYYGPFYGAYAESYIQAVYTRTLIVEALRADALPPAIKAAILHQTAADVDTPNVQTAPATSSQSKQPDLSKPPYAPPLSLDSNSPETAPYAPPILASSRAGIPQEAIVWRVEVTSGGSRPDTQKILPQLAAAAAQAVGKTMQTDVIVDSDMKVAYKLP